MRFNRLLSTAAAAALVACPALGLAQNAAAPVAAAPSAPAAPAAPPAAPLPPSPNMAPNGDWVATLKASGHFTILLKALDTNQLTAPLKGLPNLTVFAPTDEAFNALPAGQLQLLMSPGAAAQLRKVLTYHVINASVDSTKIKGAKGPVATVDAPQQVMLDGSGDTMLVNNADIIQADVRVANGVIIHVLDKVLIPADVMLPGSTAAVAPAAPSTPG